MHEGEVATFNGHDTFLALQLISFIASSSPVLQSSVLAAITLPSADALDINTPPRHEPSCHFTISVRPVHHHHV